MGMYYYFLREEGKVSGQEGRIVVLMRNNISCEETEAIFTVYNDLDLVVVSRKLVYEFTGEFEPTEKERCLIFTRPEKAEELTARFGWRWRYRRISSFGFEIIAFTVAFQSWDEVETMIISGAGVNGSPGFALIEYW